MEVKVKIATYILFVAVANLFACKTEVDEQHRLLGYWQYELDEVIPGSGILYDHDTVGLGFSHDSVLVNPQIDLWYPYEIIGQDTLNVLVVGNDIAQYTFAFVHPDSLRLIRLAGPSFFTADDTLQLSRMKPVHDLRLKYLSFSSWFDDLGFPVVDARIDSTGALYLKRYINWSQYMTECATIAREEVRDLQSLIEKVDFRLEREYEPSSYTHDWYTALVIQFENDEGASIYGGSWQTLQYHFVIGRIRRILIQSENVPCNHDVVFPSRALLNTLLR